MFRFSRSKPLILMLSSRLKVQTERVRYWKLKTMEIPGNSMCTLMDQISVIQQQVSLQVIWQLIWCHIINSYTYTYTLVSCKIFVPLIRHTIQYVIAGVMYKLKVKRFLESFGLTIWYKLTEWRLPLWGPHVLRLKKIVFSRIEDKVM